jgi:HAD superfamily hydrolase (TIGR01509 family)
MSQLSLLDGPLGAERPPTGVMWDMDGTLTDSDRLWETALRELAAELGGTLSKQTQHAVVGTSLATCVTIFLRDLGHPVYPSVVEWGRAWLNRRVAELIAQNMPWRPGARDALRAMHAAGLPMALVTSSERALVEVALETIGRDLFTATVCGDEVGGRTKPAPDPYLKGAALLKVDPEDCVAVEDSPSGAAAAEAAGCVTLVVPCLVAVPEGRRRILRTSLEGLDFAELTRELDELAKMR